jgi:hypothetical protein
MADDEIPEEDAQEQRRPLGAEPAEVSVPDEAAEGDVLDQARPGAGEASGPDEPPPGTPEADAQEQGNLPGAEPEEEE